MPNPHITFLIVSKNSLPFLKICLNSILSQSYKNFNILIIDGASTDGTANFLNSISDPRLTFISEKDNGIYDAMNKGINLIETDWMLHLGSDDSLFSPMVLRQIMELFPISKDIDIIYGRGIIGDKIIRNSFSRRLFLGNCLNHQCVIYKTKLLKTYLYDATYKIGADYKLNLQLLKQGTKSLYTPVIITNYGNEGISSSDMDTARKEELRVRSELFGFFNAFLLNSIKIIRWKFFSRFTFLPPS
jgi:putative colanic acid biosynthesis glycosyltransferase